MSGRVNKDTVYNRYIHLHEICKHIKFIIRKKSFKNVLLVIVEKTPLYTTLIYIKLEAL